MAGDLIGTVDVGGILSGLGTFAGKLREAITGKSILDPNKQAEILLETQKIEADAMKAQNALIQAQLDINKVEASSTSRYIAGGRPFIIWVCGLAFGWTYFLGPMTAYILQVCGVKVPPFPAADMSQMMPVLLGILGLGAYRSYEKVKDAEGNR